MALPASSTAIVSEQVEAMVLRFGGQDARADPGYEVRGGANGLKNLKTGGLYKYIKNTIFI